MIQEAILYHTVTIELFFALLVINLWLPKLFSRDIIKEVKATRISFFFFSAMLTMVAFTGAVLILIAKLPWSIWMSLMVVVWILLSALEIIRARKLTQLWREGQSAVSVSWRYVAAEMLIMAMMLLIATWESKDAISLP